LNSRYSNLPINFISVFVAGFVTEEVQNYNIFKNIKIVTTEFIGKDSTGIRFPIKCKYLRINKGINKKVVEIRKNSSVIDSEFQIDIQVDGGGGGGGGNDDDGVQPRYALTQP
jgi:uncharacterized membrane protein